MPRVTVVEDLRLVRHPVPLRPTLHAFSSSRIASRLLRESPRLERVLLKVVHSSDASSPPSKCGYLAGINATIMVAVLMHNRI